MPSTDSHLQALLGAANSGDDRAYKELLNHACDRLLKLTRKMLRGYPDLRRWTQTDDVCQNAVLRLHRALSEVKPASVRHFFNLAAVQIRRELLDLGKHFFGPEGQGTKHHTDGLPADDDGGSIHRQEDAAGPPESLVAWSEFHEQIDKLPDEEREVFDLLWFQGLSQDEAASVLGISLRTVKRRWQSARLSLFEALDGECPS